MLLAILRVVALGFASVPRLYTTTPFDHAVYGSGAVVCDLRGTDPLVYVQMAADTWTALADVSSGSDYSVAVPEGCRPFDHVFLSYAVGAAGHPPAGAGASVAAHAATCAKSGCTGGLAPPNSAALRASAGS